MGWGNSSSNNKCPHSDEIPAKGMFGTKLVPVCHARGGIGGDSVPGDLKKYCCGQFRSCPNFPKR